MEFRITRHSGHPAPPDAIELLGRRLGARDEDVTFTASAAEIRAVWGSEADAAIERSVQSEVGRRAVFEIVRRICERAPELDADWFAVSPVR